MARSSSPTATLLYLSLALVSLNALAAEVAVVASTLTIAERRNDSFPDEVSFSAFVRNTGLRVGGVRLTLNRPTATFQLPAGQELLIRGFRVVPSSGKMAFCNGEAYLVPSADLRYPPRQNGCRLFRSCISGFRNTHSGCGLWSLWSKVGAVVNA